MRKHQSYHLCSGLHVHALLFVNGICKCTTWENGEHAYGAVCMQAELLVHTNGIRTKKQHKMELTSDTRKSWDFECCFVSLEFKRVGPDQIYLFFKHTPPLAFTCSFLNTL